MHPVSSLVVGVCHNDTWSLSHIYRTTDEREIREKLYPCRLAVDQSLKTRKQGFSSKASNESRYRRADTVDMIDRSGYHRPATRFMSTVLLIRDKMSRLNDNTTRPRGEWVWSACGELAVSTWEGDALILASICLWTEGTVQFLWRIKS